MEKIRIISKKPKLKSVLELWNILLCTTKISKRAPFKTRARAGRSETAFPSGKSPCSQVVTAWQSLSWPGAPLGTEAALQTAGLALPWGTGARGSWVCLEGGGCRCETEAMLLLHPCCHFRALNMSCALILLSALCLGWPGVTQWWCCCLRGALGGQILEVLSGCFIWFWIWPCSVLSTISAHWFLPGQMGSLNTLIVLFFSHEAEETKW